MVFSTALLAQSPKAFNYQGVARDLSGMPLPDQQISLRLSILSGSTNGTIEFTEVQHVNTNNLGIFAVQIGTGTLEYGSMENIQWGTGDHFLQVELDENGGSNYQIAGISQLLSVPYALYASNGSRWKENPSGIFFDDGNVGIGVTENTEKLRIEDQNSLLYFKNNGNVSNNGTQLFLGHKTNGFSALYLDAEDGAGTGQDYSLLKQNNDLSLDLVNLGNNPIYFKNNGGGYSSTRLSIAANGNVGINTSTPQTKLHVTDGDVFIDNPYNGVIMKSPNGQCWRMTVSDTGQPVFSFMNCPN